MEKPYVIYLDIHKKIFYIFCLKTPCLKYYVNDVMYNVQGVFNKSI